MTSSLLFTNILLDDTIEICLVLLFYKKRKVKGMLKKHIKELLTHAVNSSTFVLNDVYYKQVDGAARGPPLGPTLANLFLVYCESKWLEDCSQQFKPQFYSRYVDDIFVMFKKRDHVKKILRYVNSFHHNIKLTCEEEKDNKILFLDISISRNNNALETSIFRKPTFSGVYTNFNSFLPTEYKRGMLHTLLYKTYNISSNYFQIHEELNHLKSFWQKNSFPLFFIDNCIHKFLNKLFIKRVQNFTTTQKKEITISLEYLGKIFRNLGRIFTS